MRRLDTKTPWFKFLSWSLSIIILIIALMISIPYLLAGAAVYFFYANEKSIEKHEVILDKRYAPILNPHPKYFFTIKGHIDKELMKTMHPRFYADYETTNDQCLRVVNSFEGVHSSRQITAIHDPTISNGNYFLKIPIDKYVFSKCGWELISIEQSLSINHTNDFNQSIAVFGGHTFEGTIAKSLNTQSEASYRCKNGNNCQLTKKTYFTSASNINLPYFNNYLYNVN